MSEGALPSDSEPDRSSSRFDPTELLQRAAQGDDAAWREIVDRYQRLVYATVRRFRFQPEDAEDVFQETFARLHRHAGRLQNPQGLARWIVQTAHRLGLDQLRRCRARGETPIPDDLPDPMPDVAEWLERIQRAQEIRVAIAALAPRCRALFEQLYFQPEPLDYREIARRLSMPIGSIGPTRARCFDALLRRLREGSVDDKARDVMDVRERQP